MSLRKTSTEVDEYQAPAEAVEMDDAGRTVSGPLEQWYYDNFAAELMAPEDVQNQIVDNLLGMDADSILDVRETLDSGTTWAYKPIILHEVEAVLPSPYGGIWVRIGIVDTATGAKHSVAIGSPTLLAQLKVLHDAGRLPAEVKIVPIRKSKEGRNPPLYFRRWDY